MSIDEANTDTQSTPKLRRWQFGMRELFAVTVIVCLWSTIAGRSMFNAVFLLVFVISFAVIVVVNRSFRPGLPLGVSVGLLVIPLILLVAFYPHRSVGPQASSNFQPAQQGNMSPTLSYATVKFIVLDADDRSPIASADVTLIPNGNFDASAEELTDSQGLASVTAPFKATWHAGPRMMTVHTIFFLGTELYVSALGYEAQTIAWEDLSQEESRSPNAPLSAPLVIELQRLK